MGIPFFYKKIKKTIISENQKLFLKSKLSNVIALEKDVSALNSNRSHRYEKEVPKEAISSFFKKLDDGTIKEAYKKRVKNLKRIDHK